MRGLDPRALRWRALSAGGAERYEFSFTVAGNGAVWGNVRGRAPSREHTPVIYVVGSGPAGVAAATALLRRGWAVTMLDAGIQIESDRQEAVRRLEAQNPEQWPERDIRLIKGDAADMPSGIPLKYAYGSAFPYAEADTVIRRNGARVGVLPSLAQGGFSNVWGAVVLPYPAEDIAEWPIPAADLDPYYGKVFSFMGLAAERDDLEHLFPLWANSYQKLPVSRQAQALLSDLTSARGDLNARGVFFGRSRLAVWPQNRAQRSCAACGLCMYGCPYGLIYNATHTLEELTKHRQFRYIGGVVVQRLSQENGRVRILGSPRGSDRQEVSFDADRVYLGAGVLSTTKIVLESLGAFDAPVTLRDSQYFVLPMMRFRATPGVMHERLHTLAQVFVEIRDDEVSRRLVHLQVHSYNDLFARTIRRQLGPMAPCVDFAARMFLERVLLVQGYLHSDESSTISVRLCRDGGGGSRLVLTPERQAKSRTAISRVVAKLAGCRAWTKAVPLRRLMRVGDPGRGFHCGGTFPMNGRPGRLQTDVLGRLPQLPGVHLIDSTTFPTVSAAAVTLTTMANAYRIADASCLARSP